MSPPADTVVGARAVGTAAQRTDQPSGPFTGTRVLLRHVSRRDRVRLPIWVGAIVLLVLVSAASVMSLYPEPEDIVGYVRLMEGNPTLTAIGGPGLGFDDPNTGVVLVNETTLWVALACAAMSIFLLTRHTRTEEESERLDLLRSGIVGRHAPTAAALIMVAVANVVVGLLVWVTVVALGFPVVGSAAFAASFTACGLVFAGITALLGQVVTTGRGTIGLSMAALGVAYVLRMVGDLGDGRLSWLSPLGWTHQVRAYAGERWWVFGLFLALTAVLVVAAGALSERRDIGGGLLPQRLGPVSAAASLTPKWGLALRLQRGQLIGWSIGLFILGAVYGAVGSDVEQMFEDNPEFEDFIAQIGSASITDSYMAYTLALGAMMAAGFAIASVMRLRTEENEGRAELMIAGPLRRDVWAWSHLWVTVLGTAVLLAASGAGTGIGLALAVDDTSQVARMLGASMVLLPAVLVLVGVAFVLFGLLPRWTVATWGALAVVVVIALFAELLRLPGWARGISPFHHTPAVPAEPVDVLPLVVLCAVALVLVGIGLVGFRRRDLAVT